MHQTYPLKMEMDIPQVRQKGLQLKKTEMDKKLKRCEQFLITMILVKATVRECEESLNSQNKISYLNNMIYEILINF